MKRVSTEEGREISDEGKNANSSRNRKVSDG